MYKELFNNYIPKCEQETVDKLAITSFISNNEDCLLRTNLIAHITSSAIVVNNKFDKVLFIHHNIYNSWGWVGGHCDGDKDLLNVAIKEAKEETGISNVKAYSSEAISIEIIEVLNHYKNGKYIGDHLHLNATFLLVADEFQDLIVKPDENSGVKWFDINSVLNHVTEDRIKSVYLKIFKRIENIKEKE